MNQNEVIVLENLGRLACKEELNSVSKKLTLGEQKISADLARRYREAQFEILAK